MSKYFVLASQVENCPSSPYDNNLLHLRRFISDLVNLGLSVQFTDHGSPHTQGNILSILEDTATFNREVEGEGEGGR